jgi:hypothetical protein
MPQQSELRRRQHEPSANEGNVVEMLDPKDENPLEGAALEYFRYVAK